MALGGKLNRARLPSRIGIEQLGEVFGQHSAAGTGRDDDVVVRFENGDELAGDRFRPEAVAAVEGRLAAAGLRPRHLDRAAGAFKELDRGETYRGSKQVDEAGDEQANARLSGHGRTLEQKRLP